MLHLICRGVGGDGDNGIQTVIKSYFALYCQPTHVPLALSRCLLSASRRLKVRLQPPIRSCPRNSNDWAPFEILNLCASSRGTPLHHQPWDSSPSSGRVWVRRWRLKSGSLLFTWFHPHSGQTKLRSKLLQVSIATTKFARLLRDKRFWAFDEEDLVVFRGEGRWAGRRDDIRRRLGPEEREVGM